jgi:hypothetical protein
MLPACAIPTFAASGALLADWWSFERATIGIWLFPQAETPEDRAVRQEGERLRKAFPGTDFDRPGARTSPPADDN